MTLTENHQLEGHEFKQAPGVGDGQGSLACYSPWGHKELDTTEQLSTQAQDLSSSHPPNSTHPSTLPGFIFSRPLITLKHTIYLTYSFVSPHQGVSSLRARASFTMRLQCFVFFFTVHGVLAGKNTRVVCQLKLQYFGHLM